MIYLIAERFGNSKKQLVYLKLIEPIFNAFLKQIEVLEMVLNEGEIIDASFIEVPRQRNKKDENKQIKEGKIPQTITSNPNKLAQKDTDARWTQKGDVNYFGYKNYVKVDSKSKIITKYVVSANVHNSQSLEEIITAQDKGQPLYGDSAYSGEPCKQIIDKKEIKNQTHIKGYKNQPQGRG